MSFIGLQEEKRVIIKGYRNNPIALMFK